MKLSDRINFNSPLWLKKLCWLFNRRVLVLGFKYTMLGTQVTSFEGSRIVMIYQPQWGYYSRFVCKATAAMLTIDWSEPPLSEDELHKNALREAVDRALTEKLNKLGIDGRVHPHAEELL